MTERSRCLTSRRQRAVLWYAADGRCTQCGTPLGPDWHADHTVPWRLTHRTNVHEMKAFCKRCNLTKGGHMTSIGLRTFQRQFQDEVIDGLIAGDLLGQDFVLAITPGGGKSSVVYMVERLLGHRIDRVCAVVPRLALAYQMERGSVDPALQALFGHRQALRKASNDPDPSRGLGGYVITYQSVTSNPDLHVQEFALHRYALILDECHHVAERGGSGTLEAKTKRAVQQLIERATLRFYMSGTMERHDKSRIAFLPYREVGVSAYELAFPPEPSTIQYKRVDALRDRAIVPLHFRFSDGTAVWQDRSGQHIQMESFTEAGDEESTMVRVALQTE